MPIKIVIIARTLGDMKGSDTNTLDDSRVLTLNWAGVLVSEPSSRDMNVWHKCVPTINPVYHATGVPWRNWQESANRARLRRNNLVCLHFSFLVLSFLISYALISCFLIPHSSSLMLSLYIYHALITHFAFLMLSFLISQRPAWSLE